MLIVVDANVLCSALLARGRTLDLLFSDALEPIAPELLFVEVERHSGELLEKTKMPQQEFSIVLSALKRRIRTVPMQEFSGRLPAAGKMLGTHSKDAQYVALALAYGCPLWSKEKRLRSLPIRVMGASEVESIISGV